MDITEPPADKVAGYRVDLTRLVTTLYMDLELQIARADTKANLILAANSIPIAGSINIAVPYVRSVQGLQHVLLLVFCLAPAIMLSALAVHYALSVAYPRLHVASSSARDAGEASFNSMLIAGKSAGEYVDGFSTRACMKWRARPCSAFMPRRRSCRPSIATCATASSQRSPHSCSGWLSSPS